jgi:xanthine dehydrogenase molybdenum-binding subunit
VGARPEVYVHQGIGNLGTHSVMDTARAAGEVLGPPWENYEIVWGNTSHALPWSSQQDGSQTTHAHTRANYAAGLDAKRKLQEIAAKELGGTPESYDVGNARVYQRGNPARALTFAQAAARAMALGGKYDGHEVSPKLNSMTRTSVDTLAGQGLIGVAKDEFPRVGSVWSFIAAFAEVEVDTETGAHRILEYLPVADVGTVLHPRSLGAQLHGGAIQGFGHARSQNIVYEPTYGKLISRRLYQNKPPTILDVPVEMQWEAVNIPDPSTPVGAKGVGAREGFCRHQSVHTAIVARPAGDPGDRPQAEAGAVFRCSRALARRRCASGSRVASPVDPACRFRRALVEGGQSLVVSRGQLCGPRGAWRSS